MDAVEKLTRSIEREERLEAHLIEECQQLRTQLQESRERCLDVYRSLVSKSISSLKFPDSARVWCDKTKHRLQSVAAFNERVEDACTHAKRLAVYVTRGTAVIESDTQAQEHAVRALGPLPSVTMTPLTNEEILHLGSFFYRMKSYSRMQQLRSILQGSFVVTSTLMRIQRALANKNLDESSTDCHRTRACTNSSCKSLAFDMLSFCQHLLETLTECSSMSSSPVDRRLTL